MIGTNKMSKFSEGHQAFKQGKLDNPYKKDTQWNREWLRGFNSAYFRNLERVEKYESRRRSKEAHVNEQANNRN